MERKGSETYNPLLTTKLVIPALRAKVVPRPRLTDRLTLSAEHRLLLVVAPAGWGKTSLIREWSGSPSNHQNRIAWISLDTGDNDLTRFLLYLAAALGNACPGLGETAHSLLFTPQPALPEVILTVLLNEISALDAPLTLMLDDYHLIEAPAVHEAMTFLLDHQPPSLNLILASRMDPPLPLARMRARGQLLEVRADDLRFTQEETAQFLHEVMGLNLDAEATARLEARTEGWIAGLQLAALSLQGQDDPSEFIAAFTGSHRYIVDYLVEEVLARQPEAVQTFLTETSILNRLCGPLCEAVLGRAGSQSILEKVEANNLFLIPLDAERRWYRYHPLFADVLRTRLDAQGFGRTEELHRRASAWYEQQGMVEEAVYHALEGKNLEAAARLIEQHCDTIWIQGGQRTLAQWLKALPSDWIEARPMLAFVQAALFLTDLQIPAALAALENCRMTEADARRQDIQGRIAVLRSNIVRFQGDYEASAVFAREALSSLSKDSPLWRGSALFSLGVALFEGDHLAGARRALSEAIQESREVGNTNTCVLASIVLGQLHEAQGALHEAAQVYRTALDYAKERKYHYAGETIVLYAGLGRVHYKWNDLDAAEAVLNEGLKRTHPVYPVTCTLELYRVKQARGDREEADAIMHCVEASQQTSFLWLPAAITALKVGGNHLSEMDRANWAREYETRLPGQRPFRMPHDLRELDDLTWARLRLAEGQAALVALRLERLLHMMTEQEHESSRISCRHTYR